jgi:hypothetical protein
MEEFKKVAIELAKEAGDGSVDAREVRSKTTLAKSASIFLTFVPLSILFLSIFN